MNCYFSLRKMRWILIILRLHLRLLRRPRLRHRPLHRRLLRLHHPLTEIEHRANMELFNRLFREILLICSKTIK